MKKASTASRGLVYHTVIIELDSTLPRRDTKKPHLYICTSLSSADIRLQQLQQGSGPGFAKGHCLSIFAKSPYSKPAKDPTVAKRRLDETIEKYTRLGHMVNDNQDEWHVYVIDLKQDHLEVKPKLSSRYVLEHFGGLNKSLSPKEKYFTSKAAEEREERLAEELCQKGYLVRAGQFTPNPKTCISKRKTKK